MKSSSVGRKSSTNPVRLSNLGDKGPGRSDPRRTTTLKPSVRVSAVGENSQIPRPRIRSDSSERASYRLSHLKVPSTKTSLATPTATTPRVRSEMGSIARGRSPSAERASNLASQKILKKDTRPLNDKSYQNSMLHRIDNFFSQAQQSSILNTSGSLRPVSLKIFVSATDFLLKLLEYKQELTLANYMEELPKIARKLHYPGAMAKSWLKTANTMHSYPHVLGWLSWLVEICEVKDLANQTFQLPLLPFVDGTDSEVINRSLFMALLELYNIWNDGKEEEEKELEEKYIKGIADQCGFTEEDMRKAQLAIDESSKKGQSVLENDQIVSREYNALDDKNSMLIADIKRQHASLAKREKTSHDLDLEIETLDKNSILLDEEAEKYQAEINELSQIIQQQEMNVGERDTIINRCTQIQSYMNRFNDHLEEIQREAWALDLKVSKSQDDFNKAILAFNRDIVINQSNDSGVDLDKLKIPETFSRTDMVETVQLKANMITNLKDEIKEELSKCQTFIDTQSTKLESLHEKLKALDQEKNELALKNDETKQALKHLRLQAKEEENKIQESIQRIQADMKDLQQAFPDENTISSNLTEAQDKLDAIKRRKMYLEQSAQRFFAKFFEILATHRNDVHKILTKLPSNFNF